MGFFSWMTKDTDESISNSSSARGTFTVYMVLPACKAYPDGKVYKEDNYEGYGVFGGKDYFEALAEINDAASDRGVGIDLHYSGKCKIWPQLVENPTSIIKDDFTYPNVDCPDQGFFYSNEGEPEDYLWKEDDEEE